MTWTNAVSSAGIRPRGARLTRRLHTKRLFFALGVLSLLTLSPTASAIDIFVDQNGPFTFDDTPITADWTTRSLGGAGNTYTTFAPFDMAVRAVTASSIASPLPIDTAAEPGTNTLARYNSTLDAIQTRASGNAATLLLGKFTNASDHFITDFLVTYDVGTFTPAATELLGHAIYYSFTGAANSWIPMDDGAGGNFYGASGGSTFFFANGLHWGNEPLYILWADDNGDTTGDTGYTIDNLFFEAVTANPPEPKEPPPPPPPPTPFGKISPTVTHTFTEATNTLPGLVSGGGIVTLADGPNGEPNDTMRVNNSALDVITDLVDLRNVVGPVTASIDFKTLDITSGFETDDTVRVYVEHSVDGTVFEALDLIPLTIGGDPDPDPLKLYDNGELGQYAHFEVTLPSTAKTARIVIAARNNSSNETFYFDNLRIAGVVVPEPGSIALFGLGAIGLVGYGTRRRRAA